MSVFARQEIIAGWRQDLIGGSRVLVYGRGWLGCFTVWALTSLGVFEVVWVGAPSPAAASFGGFLVRDHAPSLNALLCEYPVEPERPPEIDWVLNGPPVRMAIACAAGPARRLLAATAASRGIPFLDVACAARGEATGLEDPVPAMMAAALAADEFRQLVNPLPALADRELGGIGFVSPAVAAPGPVLLVGVGGIGVYCAVLLAAAGVPTLMLDGDTIEITNLNRQGLFTASDAAAARAKAEAAAERLAALFPSCRLRGVAARIGDDAEDAMRQAAPAAIVSAVDNAATRLLLSRFGARLGVPVVQAGTDLFSADCFVQDPDGPVLDQQMRGALSAAAASGAARRGGGCAANPSYVVPGMVAGAFAAARALAVLGGARALPSLHWRSGVLPRERREIRDEFACATV
jgi:hypothetical protein